MPLVSDDAVVFYVLVMTRPTRASQKEDEASNTREKGWLPKRPGGNERANRQMLSAIDSLDKMDALVVVFLPFTGCGSRGPVLRAFLQL